MFETLTAPPPDKILSLMDLFRADPRGDKIDLGVGVYRNAQGHTPILDVVRKVEAARLSVETTKSYVGPAGDPRFVKLVRDLVFGPNAPLDRLRGVQTTGGAGALRLLAGLIARARPGAVVHVPDPTWVNHLSLLSDAGLRTRTYRYYDPATGRVMIDEMIDDIGRMAPGDGLMLHGCCHNPTGADPLIDDWDLIGEAAAESGVLPFVDLAYQGFGDGLEQDAAALRLLARTMPELVVAYSCSKNFGIYRDRAGAAFILGRTPKQADISVAQLSVLARIAYSMPPDHGAAIVRDILADTDLAADWRQDVEAMRLHIASIRAETEHALSKVDACRFAALGAQKGMFSLLPISTDHVEALRNRHGIYLVSDGRINLAGLRSQDVQRLSEAVSDIL